MLDKFDKYIEETFKGLLEVDLQKNVSPGQAAKKMSVNIKQKQEAGADTTPEEDDLANDYEDFEGERKSGLSTIKKGLEQQKKNFQKLQYKDHSHG